jgi:sec-independent protein translocase protein TatA
MGFGLHWQGTLRRRPDAEAHAGGPPGPQRTPVPWPRRRRGGTREGRVRDAVSAIAWPSARPDLPPRGAGDFAMPMPGFPEMMVILVIGLLLFGKRLPEVGRSLGKGIVEFKKGLRGVEDEVDDASRRPDRPIATERDGFADVPKFELPAEPKKS